MKKAACILLFKGDQVLGVSRKDDDKAFGLPGGKLDPYETFEEAAVRECKEETGLDVHSLKEIYQRHNSEFEVKTFLASFDENQELHTNELGVVAWVTWQELFEGPFGKYNRDLYEVYLNAN